MENYKKRTVNLISNLLLEYKADPAVVPHHPAKTVVMKNDRHPLPHASPSSRGIPTEAVTELLRALENEPRANIHSIVVMKDGAIIAEASAPEYSATLPHLSHSMSKTVTGILIMTLIDSGELRLDEKITDIFPELSPKDERLCEITVEHLLTMTSGVAFGEIGSVTETEWTRAFFESELAFAPGEEFNYNSMNSYILMRVADRIARKKHGTDAKGLLTKRILAPLGIDNWFWERSPEGIFKGGWGLYLSCESWARLGHMMMSEGVYGGKRILSRESVRRATSARVSVPREVSPYDYGYQLWVEESGDAFLFNGMLGQNVWICPRHSLVVAVTAGAAELMQGSPTVALFRKLLAPKKTARARQNGKYTRELEEKCKDFFTSREWITLHAPLRGLPYLLGLKNSTPFDKALLALIGKYTFPANNLGLLPAFVSVMQNNYAGGINSVEFSRHGSLLHMRTELGCGTVELDLGIYSYAENLIEQRGERYIVRGAVCADTDGDGRAVYKINLIFPELPNSRRIALSLSPNGRLNMRLSEVPDEKMSPSLVKAAETLNPRLRALFSTLERALGEDYPSRKLGELFAPEITAISTGAPDFESALKEENERAAAKISSSRLVRALIARFLSKEASPEEKMSVTNKISDFFGRFMSK